MSTSQVPGGADRDTEASRESDRGGQPGERASGAPTGTSPAVEETTTGSGAPGARPGRPDTDAPGAQNGRGDDRSVADKPAERASRDRDVSGVDAEKTARTDTARPSGASTQRPGGPGAGPVPGKQAPQTNVGQGGPGRAAGPVGARPRPVTAKSAPPGRPGDKSGSAPAAGRPAASAPQGGPQAGGPKSGGAPASAQAAGRTGVTPKAKAAVIDGPTRHIERKDLAKDLPDLSAVAHPAPSATAAAPSAAAVAAAAAVVTESDEPLRATVQLRRIEPWSMLKVSAVISVSLFFVWMIAVGLLYGVLAGMGVWERLNDSFTDIVAGSGGGGIISAGQVFGYATVIGLVNTVLMTAIATIGAYIYNLCTDLMGGVQVTLADPD